MSRRSSIETTANARVVQRTPAELKEIIAAERTGTPFLVWRKGDGRQELLLLEPGRWRVMIGRDAGADISLGWDSEVSRSHALLESVGRGWTLVDDGLSRNGSFVNGERVLGRRRLVDRDHLRFGHTSLTYRETTVPSGASTALVIDTPSTVPLSPMQRKVLIALCRPVRDSEAATPATNRQIAEEVFLSVDAVKAHLRVLFERYGLSDLPQNAKRSRLVATALVSGLVTPRDF